MTVCTPSGKHRCSRPEPRAEVPLRSRTGQRGTPGRRRRGARGAGARPGPAAASRPPPSGTFSPPPTPVSAPPGGRREKGTRGEAPPAPEPRCRRGGPLPVNVCAPAASKSPAKVTRQLPTFPIFPPLPAPGPAKCQSGRQSGRRPSSPPSRRRGGGAGPPLAAPRPPAPLGLSSPAEARRERCGRLLGQLRSPAPSPPAASPGGELRSRRLPARPPAAAAGPAPLGSRTDSPSPPAGGRVRERERHAQPLAPPRCPARGRGGRTRSGGGR